MNEQQQLRLHTQLNQALTKLENEAERHRGARFYHMRRTNLLVKSISALIAILAIFNIHYMYGLYEHMLSIVNNVTSLDRQLISVSDDMVHLTGTMEKFDDHLHYMPAIDSATRAMSTQMGIMNGTVSDMLVGMGTINKDMDSVNGAMYSLNINFNLINLGVHQMSGNITHFSRPMGLMNNFMP